MIRGPVVSDTTPLINLVGIGLLDLLPRLYSDIQVPQEVVTEYQAKALPTEPDIGQLPWLTIVDAVSLDPTLPKLGLGEAAAISLAKAVSARFIFIDERRARRIATSQGLVVVGTLAVLVRAKGQGLIPTIKPHIDTMQAQGRRFSDDLIAQVLQGVGE